VWDVDTFLLDEHLFGEIFIVFGSVILSMKFSNEIATVFTGLDCIWFEPVEMMLFQII
jgi:hypothetical protein